MARSTSSSRNAARVRKSAAREPDWPRVAASLAARIPPEALHRAVLAWADGRGAAARGAWGIAFSGGSDSLALLLLMWAHWPDRRRKLLALHFNHQLRGAAADGDAAFCAGVCRSLGVRLKVGVWNRRQNDSISEASARRARFAFFDAELRRAKAGALWLGHQKDDIAETLLMRLARGSGTAGLAAPRPVQVLPEGRVNLRPLLTFSKKELCDRLSACGARWREDATNRTPAYFRNRIRAAVLPEWVKATADRDVLTGAALSRDLLDEDAEALEAWLRELRPLRRRVLDLRKLKGKPRALVRRGLQHWMAALGAEAGDLSRQGFEALLSAIEAGSATRFSVGKRGFAVTDGATLTFERKARTTKPI